MVSKNMPQPEYKDNYATEPNFNFSALENPRTQYKALNS